MQVYCVGGAVRDELLGLPVTDRDWVVVGATPEDMARQGYRPVGRDFPVFLHPDTHEEYALARTERKVSRGYHGFEIYCSPEVTLEDDLRRRDLTVNAMARAADGTLIDPYGGLHDLHARVLRHVSEAFEEDPVRILRLARFAARFADFSINAQTLTLVQRMVAAGEVDALVPERVWQELSRGLMQPHPARMIEVLDACGALARLLPDLAGDGNAAPHPTVPPERLRALERSARLHQPLDLRYALMVADPQSRDRAKALARVQACSARLKVPVECRDLARLTVSEYDALDSFAVADPTARQALLERIDALRRPERALTLACACEILADALAQAPLDQAEPGRVVPRITRAIDAARSVDAGAIAARVSAEVAARGGRDTADRIRDALRRAREQAIAALAGDGPDITDPSQPSSDPREPS